MGTFRRLWVVVFCGLCTVISVGGSSAVDRPTFSGGTGDANDPFQIRTARELLAIGSSADLLDKHFVLTGDLDLDPSVSGAGTLLAAPIASVRFFTGTFDGHGHSIRHLKIQAGNSDCAGLFGFVGEQASLKAIVIEDCNIIGGDCTGTLAGSSFGDVSGCYATGTVTGRQYAAGLVGVNAGTLRECRSDVDVKGEYAIGGLVAANLGQINSSQAAGQLHGGDYVGGLAGMNFGSVRCSKAVGQVVGERSVGGLVGYDEGTMQSCYALSSVVGVESVGGLVGHHWSGLVSYCYAAASVSGQTQVGGLVGASYEGSVYLSYWDTAISGQTSSAGGRGKTPNQMKSAAMYKGWGQAADWTIDDGSAYPNLLWEGMAGSLIEDPSVRYGGGNGQWENPFRIASPEHFSDMAYYCQDYDKHFVLTTDVNLAQIGANDLLPIGTPGVPFTGVFDGNDHAIVAPALMDPLSNWQGLFGVVGSSEAEPNQANGLISGLTVRDARVIGSRYCGILAGENHGTVTSVQVSGEINGTDTIGGIVGRNEGMVVASHIHATIRGERFAGGVAGSSSGILAETASSGTMCATDDALGGVAGANMGAIQQSFAIVDMEGTGSHAGGISGVNWSGISDSYAQGAVHCLGDYAGGLVGSVEAGRIAHCYSTCVVSGSQVDVGGLLGWAVDPNCVLSCFWDIETSGWSSSCGGIGLITLDMQTSHTFQVAGWDLVGETVNGVDDIWTVDQGRDYPRLRWERR